MWNFIVFFCHQQLWRNKDKNISVKILFCCWGIYFSYEPPSVAWWSKAPSIQSNMSYVCGQKCLQIMIWAQSMQLDLLFPFQAKGLIHMHDVFHEVRSVWVHRQSSIFEMISVWDGLTPFLIDRSLSGVPSPFFSQLPCPRKRALLCIALLFTGSWHIARASWSVFWCHVSWQVGATSAPVAAWLPPSPSFGLLSDLRCAAIKMMKRRLKWAQKLWLQPKTWHQRLCYTQTGQWLIVAQNEKFPAILFCSFTKLCLWFRMNFSFLG